MHGTKEIIEEASALPVEERAMVAESLLRSLNGSDAELDKVWSGVAERRLAELRAGRVVAVSGDEVLARVRERFAR